MVNFQTYFEKYPLLRAPQRPGASPEAAPGVFFQNVFENEPYLAHSILKIAIWLVFQNLRVYGMRIFFVNISCGFPWSTYVFPTWPCLVDFHSMSYWW